MSTTTTVIPAPPGYSMLIYIDGAVEDAPLLAYIFFDGNFWDYDAVDVIGQHLTDHLQRGAIGLPDGRVAACGSLFTNRAAWVEAVKRVVGEG